MAKRQVVMATYLIDKWTLRVGIEKVVLLSVTEIPFHLKFHVWWISHLWLRDDDEADIVDCCTLKVENVEPQPPNILKVTYT